MNSRIDLLKAQMKVIGLDSRPQSLIDGALVDGTGAMITLIDPFTEQPLVTYQDAAAELAIEACKVAQAVQSRWATLSGVFVGW